MNGERAYIDSNQAFRSRVFVWLTCNGAICIFWTSQLPIKPYLLKHTSSCLSVIVREHL